MLSLLYCAIYCCLLFVLLVVSVIRKSVLGSFLVFLYFASGLLGIWGMIDGMYSGIQITLSPFLFLFAGYVLYFSPFLSKKMPDSSQICYSISSKLFNKIAMVYSVMALLAIIFTLLPQAWNTFSNANWSESRQMLYDGELKISSPNMFIHACTLFTLYLYYAATFFGCLLIVKEKTATGFIVLIVSQTFLFLQNIITSSRGVIFYQILYNFSFFLFFWRNIKRTYKNIFLVAFFLLIMPLFNLMADITNDRFGDNNEIESIVDYLGHPPIMFNYGVYPINSHLWGEYALGDLFVKRPFDQNMIGGKWGSSFYTFMGFLYIDWGVIGTLSLGLFVAFFFFNYFKRKQLKISESYLLFEYYRFLVDGVFVIGRGIFYRLLSIVLAYVIFKVLEEIYPQSDTIITQNNE